MGTLKVFDRTERLYMCWPLISVASLLISGIEEPPTHAQEVLLVVSCIPVLCNLDSSANHIIKPNQYNKGSQPPSAKSLISMRGPGA